MAIYGEGVLLSLQEPLRWQWTLDNFTRFEVGGGSRINFWHDQWCGETALKVAFPVLYGLTCAKDTSIATNLKFLGSSN
jgi:hypothetical protein